MLNEAAEKLGFGLLIAFAYLCWPPAALLVAGLLLIAWANVRSARATGRSRAATAVVAAWRAGRHALEQQRDVEPLTGPRRVA